MRDFRYLLQGEMDSIQAVRYPDLPDKKIMTVARKVHTRRAFANWGGNGSGTYMRELLELVRVCQATLTHVGLLAIGYLLFAVVLGCKLIPFPCPWGGAARGVINVTAIAWVLSYAPRIHDPKEYYYPVLALLLAVAGPVLFFSFTRMPTLRLTLTQGRHALLQLAIGFALAILISYFATFSWSEHRENYFESAIVLGAAAAEKETDSTSASAELAKSIVTDFETSGSAVVGVVGKRLLIADDELVGTVLDCPEPLLNPWNCGLVRIERKRPANVEMIEHLEPRCGGQYRLRKPLGQRVEEDDLVAAHRTPDRSRLEPFFCAAQTCNRGRRASRLGPARSGVLAVVTTQGR